MKKQDKEVQKNSLKKWLFGLLVLAVIVFLPIPYILEVPGSPINAADFMTVEQTSTENTQQKGQFLVTTVGIQQATLFTSLFSILPHHTLVTEKEFYGDQSNNQEYNLLQTYYMESAKNNSLKVAFDYAQKKADLTFKGIYIMSFIEGSNFSSQLQIGDLVTAIDQQEFDSSADFIAYVQGLSVGQEVSLTYEREGQSHQAKAATMENPSNQKAALGIQLVDHTVITTDPKVNFDDRGVGGPSAGLIFTLEAYDQLNGGNLAHGHIIAGTGTMSLDGSVGRIGGIDMKVVAADKAGIKIFLAPDDEITAEMLEYNPQIKSNYQEALDTAKEIGSNMQIVPVKTFRDALDFLANLKDQ